MTPLRAGRVFALMLLLTIAAQYLHEAGHWFVYQALGRQPVWGFIGVVQVWGETPVDVAGWTPVVSRSGESGWLRVSSDVSGPVEGALAAAGGPLASVFGALIGWVVGRRSQNETRRAMGVGLVLTTAVAMGLYYARSPWRTGGDEQDIADALGIARWPLDAGLGGYFAVIFGMGLRELKPRRARALWAALALVSGPLIGITLAVADGVLRQATARGDPLTVGILGYSLPVALVGVVGVGLLWVWSQWPLWSATQRPG